jgi:hypothetical protein
MLIKEITNVVNNFSIICFAVVTWQNLCVGEISTKKNHQK